MQALLGVVFATGGLMKATQPIPELAAMMVWPGELPPALVRFIGLAELAGALGLVLPALTRIKPRLTPLAATGLALITVLAAVFHLWRGEPQVLPVNLVFGGLAALIAWGRWKRAPIPARA